MKDKTPPHNQPQTKPRTPVAPPVYRPETKKIVQPKIAGKASQLPKAPPVYRPQPPPKVLQTKQARDGRPSAVKQGTTAQGRLLLPHEMARVSAPHRVPFQVVQRAEANLKLEPWKLDEIREAVTPYATRRDQESVDEQAARIQQETVPLTKFFGAVKYNCYAWALGETSFEDPGGTLATWKHRLGNKYTFVDANSNEATILLWGEPPQKKNFPEVVVNRETLKTIPDPFWSSAMGFGFGVMVHPKNFFHGGQFGSVLVGMKAK